MKKKVFIIGPAHPYRGGIAASNERLAYAFQTLGHELVIHTFKLQYPSFLFPGKTQFSNEKAPQNLAIQRTINSINPINWYRIGRQIAAEKPDIVMCRFWLPFLAPCFGTIGRIIKKYSPTTRLITIADNIIPHEKRIGDRQLTQYFVNTCDGFVTMSKSVLVDLEQFTDSKNKKYIPHPIYDNYGPKVRKSDARDLLKIDQKAKVLLFFGLIRNYKGLDLLLEAMADARIKEQQVQLMIVGEYYDDENYYADLIKKYDLSDCIMSEATFIPDDAVKQYFCAADMIVQPYKTATQSGISQIAYHFERPMLVTNVGGLPEIVPDGVVGYVTEKNPTQIADAIIDFYEKDREAFFSQNVAIEKKRFSWENLANAVLDLAN